MPRHTLSILAMLGLLHAGPACADDRKAPPPTPDGLLAGQLKPVASTPLPQGSDFTTTADAEAAANATPGPRTVPGRVIPVPTTVSPQFSAQVAAPYRTPDWNADPKTNEEWKALIAMLAAKGAAKLPALRDKLGVVSEPTTIGGVKAFIVQAKTIPAGHRDKIILAIHGGGFVYNPGEAGTLEAILMAGFGGYKVISVDYRMAPDFPFPAANDDVLAAYKELLKANKPGTSG